MKCKIITVISIVFAVLSIAVIPAAAQGTGIGIQGDLLPQSFPEDFPEKSEKLSAFEREVSDIMREYLEAADMRVTIAAYVSPESTGISPEVVGTDLETFADAFADKELQGLPTENSVMIFYVEETNECTWREFIQDGNEVKINWDSVQKILEGNTDIQNKIRNVCQLIVNGETQKEAGNPITIIIIIAVAIVIVAGAMIFLFRKQSLKKA